MRRQRILIVDDEAKFTSLLKKNLELTGRFTVEQVNNPTEALATAQEFRPDLVFMDVIMPGTDGSVIAASFKENEDLANVPIVFLTAIVSRDEVGTQETMIGGQVFLIKPVTVEKVIECIENLLGKSS